MTRRHSCKTPTCSRMLSFFGFRRLFCVTDYFLFFFNALLSLFTSLKRIVMSMVIGVIYLTRLDQSGMMRGFERFDNGNTVCVTSIKLIIHIHHHSSILSIASRRYLVAFASKFKNDLNNQRERVSFWMALQWKKFDGFICFNTVFRQRWILQ